MFQRRVQPEGACSRDEYKLRMDDPQVSACEDECFRDEYIVSMHAEDAFFRGEYMP
jgi:hypothetical protein